MKDNQKDNNQSKQILLSVLAVAILVVAVIGVTFAAFVYTKTGEKVNQITTGTINMEYTEGENGIEITDAMPVSDAVGAAITPDSAGTAGTTTTGHGVFDFTVKATIKGTTSINYEVSARKIDVTGNDTTEQLPDTAVKLYLEKDAAGGTNYTQANTKFGSDDTKTGIAFSQAGEASDVGTPATNMLLDSGTFTSDGSAEQTVNYRLRMWVAESFDMSKLAQGKKGQYKVRVDVYGKAAVAGA